MINYMKENSHYFEYPKTSCNSKNVFISKSGFKKTFFVT